MNLDNLQITDEYHKSLEPTMVPECLNINKGTPKKQKKEKKKMTIKELKKIVLKRKKFEIPERSKHYLLDSNQDKDPLDNGIFKIDLT